MLGNDLNDRVRQEEVIALGLFERQCGKCITDAVERAEKMPAH